MGMIDLLKAGEPLVIGHRGAAGYAPENTMVAFERGLSLRADAIELDVNVSKDGELIVIHDPTLNRTTSGSGLVLEHTLAEIKALDAGSWFDPSFSTCRVPTLREVLHWARGRTRVVIELKNGPIFYSQLEQRVLSVLDELDMREDVLVISFDHVVLHAFKQLAPDVPVGALYASRMLDPVTMAREIGAEMLMPYWPLLTRPEVEAAHAAGLLISPWGGPEQNYAYLLEIGVDAVGADYPDRPREILDARAQAD